MDTYPTLPHLEHVDEVPVRPEERRWTGQYVHEASADDTGDDQPQRHVEQLLGVESALLGQPQRPERPDQHAECDEEAVPPDGQRSYLDENRIHSLSLTAAA